MCTLPLPPPFEPVRAFDADGGFAGDDAFRAVGCVSLDPPLVVVEDGRVDMLELVASGLLAFPVGGALGG